MQYQEEQPIDFVITWVDGSDVKWLEEKRLYNPDISVDDSVMRYRDFGTLKYLFRSIEKFAPWVRRIFLITNGQVPKWLDLQNKKVVIVKHSEYMPEEYLPTFSSHPIEWNFHRIKDLSENFVYFNDDVLLTDYVEPTDFFKNNMPCDSFGLDFFAPKSFFSHIAFNNMLIVNSHFDFKKTMRQNRKKYFSIKNGKPLIKTILLSTRNCFYNIEEAHIAMSLKKSFFDLLWKKEPRVLDETCKNRFRSKNDVSLWLVRYWQLLEGAFEPRSAKFGKYYSIQDFIRNKNIKNEILRKKYKVLCVNDNELDFCGFEDAKRKFEEIIDVILGEKCSFEKT